MVVKGINGLNGVLKDIGNNVKDNKKTFNRVLSSEFVRLNEPNMFYDTGKSKSDVKSQTDYDRGRIQGQNPYFAFVYYGTSRIRPGGKRGKPEPFKYTYEQNKEYLTKTLEEEVAKKINEKT